jgi:5-formyltetrahydrofolate cyclo-ligase
MNDRQTIRQNIRLKRKQLSPALAFQASLAMGHYIVNTSWFRNSRRIAFYSAVQGELDPCYVMQRALNMQKHCYLPVCHPLHFQTLFFAPYYSDSLLKPNRYGILEPDIKIHPPCKPFTLDLVFMPLLAFDKKGHRLGSGKGYYDRTFAYLQRTPAALKPLLVGLAYQFQQVEQIAAQPWDIPLDKVIVI